VNLKFKWFAAASFCLLLLGGCGKDESEELNYKSVVFCSDVDVVIDPQIASSLSGPKVFNALFEGLVIPDPKTYEPLPGVADSWSISEDGRIYEFHLRDDAKWSNGDPVVAGDFVFSVKRALSSRSSLPFLDMFFPLRNAERFHKQQVRHFNEVGIQAMGKHILRIELERPLHSFMYMLMQPCWYPANGTVRESLGGYGEWGDFSKEIISNGPFMAINKDGDRNIILRKNPYYWDYGAVKLDEIRLMISSNVGRNLALFRNGLIDICTYSPQHMCYASDLIENNEVKTDIHFGCFFLVLNTKNKPLDDENIRVALGTAVRRKALLKLLSMDDECAAYGLIPMFGPKYKSAKMFSENLVRARELLAAAGYENGENFPKMRIICDGGVRQRTICTFLGNELKKTLNIDTCVECVGGDEVLAMRRSGDFDICCCDWYKEYPDPEEFLRLFSGKNQQNYCRWHSNEYDELLRVVSYTQDKEERLRLLKDAEQLLMREMPIIPLYFESSLYLLKRRVRGWDSCLLDLHEWKFIDVDDDW
jgi:oligopeptide transport system substrate-binding protein